MSFRMLGGRSKRKLRTMLSLPQASGVGWSAAGASQAGTATAGVMLSASAETNASGTLMAEETNVSLESGTRVALGNCAMRGAPQRRVPRRPDAGACGMPPQQKEERGPPPRGPRSPGDAYCTIYRWYCDCRVALTGTELLLAGTATTDCDCVLRFAATCLLQLACCNCLLQLPTATAYCALLQLQLRTSAQLLQPATAFIRTSTAMVHSSVHLLRCCILRNSLVRYSYVRTCILRSYIHRTCILRTCLLRNCLLRNCIQRNCIHRYGCFEGSVRVGSIGIRVSSGSKRSAGGPGPAPPGLLEDIMPAFARRRCDFGHTSLRYLAGGSGRPAPDGAASTTTGPRPG